MRLISQLAGLVRLDLSDCGVSHEALGSLRYELYAKFQVSEMAQTVKCITGYTALLSSQHVARVAGSESGWRQRHGRIYCGTVAADVTKGADYGLLP
jgi:hypothetical protein